MIRGEGKILLVELQRTVWEAATPAKRQPIIEWVNEHKELFRDPTAAISDSPALHPYQVAPLAATEHPDVREIDLMASQRTGKSKIWHLSTTKRIYDGRLIGMVLYQNKDLATDTNRDCLEPLLSTIPQIRMDMAMRGNKKKDSYHLPSRSSILYFSGSTPAISKTLNFGVIDEADFHAIEKSDDEGANTSNITALKIRMQTYKDECLLIVVSSPTLYGGAIYQRWSKGSRGIWHLRCLGCGELSPGNRLAYPTQSGAYRGLQWSKDDNGNVVEASIRWICPICGRGHVEAEAGGMNAAGDYVHENPAQIHHLSYQVGALGAPQTWRWIDCADAQEGAVTVDGRKYLRNTVCGMPYKPQRAEGSKDEEIADVLASRQVEYPADLDQRVSFVMVGADTQGTKLAEAKYWIWVARAFAENGDSWRVGYGLANSLAELHEATSGPFLGQQPLLRMVDSGGYDISQDLEPFVKSTRGWVMYKGTDSKEIKTDKWRQSDNETKLILANAVDYQVLLLDLLYGPKRPSGYQWWLPKPAGKDYLDQVWSVRPNLRAANGDSFGRWTTIGRRDYFDCEKIILVAIDAACKLVSAPLWPRHNIPLYKRIELIQELKRKAAAG